MTAAVRALTKDFDGVRALDGVDVDLAGGAIHGLLGRTAPAGPRCCGPSPAWTVPPRAR